MLSGLLSGQPVGEEDFKLRMDQAPILATTSPLFRDVHRRQVQHFQEAVVGREDGLGLGDLAELAVKALNGVGRVDDPADLSGVLEIGAQPRPILPPRASTTSSSWNRQDPHRPRHWQQGPAARLQGLLRFHGFPYPHP